MSQIERSPGEQRPWEGDRGTFDDNAGSRSVKGAARGEEKAHHAEGGRRAVRTERAVGEEISQAAAEGGRPRSHTPFAGQGVESQDSAESAAEGSEDRAGRIRRFWADVGSRISGRAARHRGGEGD